MKEDRSRMLKSFLNTGFVLAVIVFVLGFMLDARITAKYGGIDLRNRVVGARCMMEGIDPYYFKWSQDKSDLLLDPSDDRDWPISRVSVPPGILILHTVIAEQPYRNQRQMWFIFQWALLLLSIFMLARSTDSEVKFKSIWMVGLIFIGGSYFWRLHVERGQIYILYTFLVAVAYWIARRSFKNSSIVGGFVLGLTASLRPPVIFMGIPMVIYKKWKMLIGVVAGVLCGLGGSLMIGGLSLWESYITAMRVLGKIHSGILPTGSGSYFSSENIEGMDNLAMSAPIPFYNSSIQDLFIRFFGIRLPSGVLLISLVLVLLFISVLLFKFRAKSISTTVLFLIGAAIVLVSEFFIPAWCFSYNNVMWLIPLSLIIIHTDSFASLASPPLILLLIGFFFSVSFVAYTPQNIISDGAITAYVAIVTFSILRKNHQQEIAAMCS